MANCENSTLTTEKITLNGVGMIVNWFFETGNEISLCVITCRRTRCITMWFTRARRDCSYPSRRGRRWSCLLTARWVSCARGPRRPRNFPLYTSSPRRRWERRASKSADTTHVFEPIEDSASLTRVLAQTARLPRFPALTIWLPERRRGHHASRSGGWRLNSPVTLLLCYGDPTPQCESPH